MLLPISLIIIIALIFSAFFSGMEIAFISANRLKIELDNKTGGYKAKLLAYFAKKPEWFIGSMLLGNNISMVVYSWFMGFILKPLIEDLFLKISWMDSAALVLFVQTLISTIFILIFAEFLPKALFRMNPNGTLSFLAVPLILIYSILWLPTIIVIGIAEGLMFFFIKDKLNKNDKVAFEKIDLDNKMVILNMCKGGDSKLNNSIYNSLPTFLISMGALTVISHTWDLGQQASKSFTNMFFEYRTMPIRGWLTVSIIFMHQIQDNK